MTPFALADTFVRALDPALLPSGCPVTVNPDGSITSAAGGPARCPAAGAAAGRFVGALNDPARRSWMAAGTIGRLRPPAVAAPCALVTSFAGYGPVTSSMASGTNRVIGFVPVLLSRTGACPPAGSPFAARVVRGPSMVAPANATASLYGGLPLPATVSEAEIAEFLDKHFARNGRAGYGALLVPVLAR